MDLDVSIHTDTGSALRGSLVVIGSPTLGLVGTITAHYLVRKLEMPRVGSIHSSHFEPIALVKEGRAVPPIRLHAVEASCGLDLRCDKLVVILSELMPDARMAHGLADAVAVWAKANGCPLVIVPDGVPRDDGEPDDEVWGAASLTQGVDLVRKAGVDVFDEAVVSGLSAAMLNAGERHGVNVVSLFAETSPEYPDAKAAARIVEILDRFLPDIHLETTPLLKEAEEIEAAVRAMQAEMGAKARAHSPMFG